MSLGALLMATACQGPGNQFLRNGIGSELPAQDIEASTRLLDRYFQHLCRQSSAGSCEALPRLDRTTWTLIVRQGMNDIDRRCDAYLEWLDDLKRSRSPLRKQVDDVRTATTGIMSVIDPRSAAALQVVSFAFDLITRSLDNYNSRLLLEVESSTINSIVIRARQDFRNQVHDLQFETRPDAEYALRSYLRLCLPFAIETNINDYSTLGSLGIEVSTDRTINALPSVGRALREDAPRTVFVPVKPTKPIADGEEGGGGGNDGRPPDTAASGRIEQSYSRNGVMGLQSKLCVPQTGRFDNSTRSAITVVESAIGSERANGMIDTGKEQDVIEEEPPGCNGLPTGARNTFEKFAFRAESDQVSARMKVTGFQKALLACIEDLQQSNNRPFTALPAGTEFATGTLNSVTRDAIKYVVVDLSVDDKTEALRSGLLSASVFKAIQNCQ